jgi:hypothetical protein
MNIYNQELLELKKEILGLIKKMMIKYGNHQKNHYFQN